MKLTDEQIQEMQSSLDKIKTANWGGSHFDDETPFMSIMGNDCVSFATNAPTWIRQLLADRQAWKEEAERLRDDVEDCVRYGEEYRKQLNQAVEVLKKAEKFIDAILSFYGQNLMVFNWHQNEDGEPWDNFFDDNMDGDELEIIQNFLSSLSEGGKP